MNDDLPQPHRTRPVFPDGYGIPDGDEGLISWSDVEAKLREARYYWMATVRPDQTPHVVPRWGVWHRGSFWYDGAPSTVHARNLTTNPACVLHLESGKDTVILEGTSRPADPPGPVLGAQLSEAYAKYAGDGYTPAADAWDGEAAGGLMVFTPRKGMAWNEFPTDATKFVFDR